MWSCLTKKSKNYLLLMDSINRLSYRHVWRKKQNLQLMLLWQTRSNVHHTKVLPLSLSDHDCVMCVSKINHRKMPFRTITCRDYSTYNHTVLARDIENYDWNPVYIETNVSIALDYMEQGLTSIIDSHGPKNYKTSKRPQMSLANIRY